jgi:dephospho-CoA kinase
MVGLTGGIGAGKSVVAGRLAELGAVVIDSDRLAREVVEPGTDGLREVVEEFGREVLGPDGALDRPALGRLVFGDDAARRRLEAIVHPRVRARSAELIAAAPPDAVVVNDIPLLVESGIGAGFDLVVVVLAGEETRLRRLAGARGMTVEEARARMAAQATDEQRRAAADVVLDNDGSREDLLAAVDRLWYERLRPAAG